MTLPMCLVAARMHYREVGASDARDSWRRTASQNLIPVERARVMYNAAVEAKSVDVGQVHLLARLQVEAYTC